MKEKKFELRGNDFSYEEIEKWFLEEEEAYSSLKENDKKEYRYNYNNINIKHGFSKIKNRKFEKVLGIGSAWGYEFEPIINKIASLYIIEASEKMRNRKIGPIIPQYIKPDVLGTIPFKKNYFDLITCFGTLHHIPNVSYVFKEMVRVLSPGGYVLIREPIVSMGNPNRPRKGLTKNERGIPTFFFENEFKKYDINIISSVYCFTVTSIFNSLFKPLISRPIYNYQWYIILDKYLSLILKNNVHYESRYLIHKIAPSSIFYVIKKIAD